MNLFAFGTLMDPEIMAHVSGVECRFRRAVLSHYVRKTVRGEVYPAIARRHGFSVDGIVYFDLPSGAFERLDRFEGHLYVRTEVVAICDSGEHVNVQAYVIAPSFSDRLSDDDWSYENFQKNNKTEFKRRYRGYKELE